MPGAVFAPPHASVESAPDGAGARLSRVPPPADGRALLAGCGGRALGADFGGTGSPMPPPSEDARSPR